MSKPKLTLNELTQTIIRSKLPTLVTEGIEDYLVFRRIEDKLSYLGISLLPAGGRDMVLQLFNERKSFGRNDVGFLVDKDLWVFIGVPDKYTHRKIITTDGYSIENDLYRDGNLEKFLERNEKLKFDIELNSVLAWFSFVVRRKIDNPESEHGISDHPTKILNDDGFICPKYASLIGYSEKDSPIYEELKTKYVSHFRGKNLFNLLCRQLSSSKRAVNLGKKHLLEFCVVSEGKHYLAIEEEIRSLFHNV